MSEDVFLLDTNVFIQAHRAYYAFDVCPGFWDVLTHYNSAERIISLDRVRDEITGGEELVEWVGAAPADLFVSSADQAVATKFGEMMAWVQGVDFTDAAKAAFAEKADGWLIAFAQVHSLVLVTHEIFDANAKKRVKIPNVCRQFQVRHLDTFGMLRELGATFDWAPPAP